jgi:hypothetical protein
MPQRYKMFGAPSTSKRDVALRVKPFSSPVAILNFTWIYRTQTAPLTSGILAWKKGVSL